MTAHSGRRAGGARHKALWEAWLAKHRSFFMKAAAPARHQCADRELHSPMFRKELEEAGERLVEFDDHAHKFFEPYVNSKPVRALDLFSKLGDQPELRLIAGGLLVAGTFANND